MDFPYLNMDFELRVVKNTPLTGENDYENVAETFLKWIGYLSEGTGRSSIAYRLFLSFLLHPKKEWMVEELATELETTKATIYRHLNKLKGLDILEEKIVGDKKEKGYCLRYGNFSNAWNFVEAHVKVAMDNYGKTVEHLQELVSK